MKLKISPINYYFYRPHLYTIQFAFKYEKKLPLTTHSEGIEPPRPVSLKGFRRKTKVEAQQQGRWALFINVL